LVARRRKIVFAASSGGVGGATDLFVMNADGSGITQITHTPQLGGQRRLGSGAAVTS
jgi:Tol biopolymer transport system component